MSEKRKTDWSQIIGTVAVIIGLVLVWEELRLNRQAIERQATVERYTALSAPFFESDALLSASEKVRQVDGRSQSEAVYIETYGHTPEEALAWTRHMLLYWGTVRADWEHGDRDGAERTVENLLSYPDARLFAESNPWGPSAWAEFIETKLAETP
jgi:hypothetical protein